MKQILFMILTCLGLTASAQSVIEAGVSKALAEGRVAAISNLSYNLRFTIPADRHAAVTGSEVIRFDLKHPTEIVLDFRAPADNVVSVKSNGRDVPFVFQDEHIVIPTSATRSGHNTFSISFVACDQSLNRSDDYMYTLFVPDRARTAFPCFDQPDLKGRYRLTLDVPAEWCAVSNTKVQESAKGAKNQGSGSKVQEGLKTIEFAESEPLPTYLFAFAAGRFEYQQHTAGGRTIGAYYRETDPRRIGQLPEIFRQVEYALRWQEEFTGVPYPFAKYDLVILPGFQFGGMEHTGATFYNDNTIFLSPNPTPDEVLARANLIAHETSHMWFGDYVTMRWFDDVWTKEVFANYFAAEITAPQFPDVNHTLDRLRTYVASAYSEDRTWAQPLRLANGEEISGAGTSIRQPLDNLRNAGLVYNRIIYNKAPVVMYKIVEIMGQEAFRRSIQEYVRTYAYGNASWDELVEIFDRNTTADMKAFSRAWVNEKGMPTIQLDLLKSQSNPTTTYLTAVQHDPHGRGLTWPQSFSVRLMQNTSSALADGPEGAAADTLINISFSDASPSALIALPAKWNDSQIIPNADGRGYGIFATSPDQLRMTMHNWRYITTGTERQAVLMNLHENYLVHNIPDGQWLSTLIDALASETDPLTASTICGYISEPLLRLSIEARDVFIQERNPQMLESVRVIETRLKDLAENHPIPSTRIEIIRLLSHRAIHRITISWLADIWQKGEHPLLSVRDYMMMSYELAVRRPSEAEDILQHQHERLLHPTDGSAPNADRLREFDFVSRAVIPSRHYSEALFEELLTPEGRRIEPWASRVLSYLNHPLREGRSTAYIRPALDALVDVQRTGDIFFPANWCAALLGEHTSTAARAEVERFLNDNPDYLPLLRNKILNGAYTLFR